MLFSRPFFIIVTAVVVAVQGGPSLLPACPTTEDIFPCTCYVDVLFQMHMDCSLVSSELELSKIFSHDFPSKNFQSLHIAGNDYINTLHKGMLGESTFKELTIDQGALETVEPEALLGSAATLTKLQLKQNRLKSFPFEEIASYEKLEKLYLSNNKITVFPRITSASLKDLNLAQNPIGTLQAEHLQGLQAIESIYLFSCNIAEVHTGTFTGLNNLFYLTLAANHLTSLSSNSFELHGPNARLFFTSNNISSVANDSITGVSYFLNVSANNLVYLEEDVWRPILEGGALLALENEPLACGCDLAWLVRNETLMALIYEHSKCSNGTPLWMLDPLDFEIC